MEQRKGGEHRLQLGDVVEELCNDGLLDVRQMSALKQEVFAGRQAVHPLTAIAYRRWTNATNPFAILDIEVLCEWQAAKAGLSSYAYAKRFNILALEATNSHITVATAEPYVNGWVSELERINGRPVKRVLADPEKIASYLVEFYSLSRSVHSATGEGRAPLRFGMQNFEHLLELGRVGKLEADDKHIVNIVDWLLQYAYNQRASDIHIEPRREQTHIGDSQFSIQPKSGHTANSQAKVCADAILRSFSGNEPSRDPATNSACYTPISAKNASWLSANYQFNPTTGTMQLVQDSFDEAKKANGDNYEDMFQWAENIFKDSFG